MPIEIILSGDGSHTLFNPDLNETYHSHHGALQESIYVFIEKGLDFLSRDLKEITVLEVGFGTGLNAILAFQWAEKNKIKLNYHTLEPYPLSQEIYKQLNYLELLDRNDLKDIFLNMHSCDEKKLVDISEYFSFCKYYEKLENLTASITTDIVFYDAFAPNKQPEVWSLENFQKTFNLLKDQGILVSYCASGQFKRNLKEVGYIVEPLPGPPGKKEMTRGIKK